jgi:hypothetical protein
MAAQGSKGGQAVVCEQGEWDAMAAAGPGGRTLIRGGIPSESEAEQLARQTGYDPAKSKRW